MSEFVLTEVRKGYYLDSVALMRLSREINAMDGVIDAALMMGSPSNIVIMQHAGLISDSHGARSNDLVLVLKATSEALARAALTAAVAALDRPKQVSSGADDWRPRSIASAVRAHPKANLCLISVPGDFAAAESRKALRRGLNVMMFSDNVSIEDELSLKQEARELGLLMMGPDCGTAIINGAPIGFANAVNRGGIGIVGASGTGTQEVSALVSEAGQGISHAIGVGGRDLKKDIGGIMSLMAMDALEEDEMTESVVFISKPPHPEVAKKIIARISESAKRYTVCFLGAEKLDLPSNAQQATSLRDAAELALGGKKIGSEFDVAKQAADKKAVGGQIRGLFCGGTLCAEAQVVLGSGGRKIASNAAIPGVPGLEDEANAGYDRLIDLGADEFTVGRAHPMIDPSLRDEMVREALQDEAVGVVLVDLVIGYGAHVDPAGQLAEVLAKVLAAGDKSKTQVIASVTGTEADPQTRSRQVAKLEAAGVIVAPSNAHACELALAIISN